MAATDKVKVVHILSDEEKEVGKLGLEKKFVRDSSQVMYTFLKRQTAEDGPTNSAARDPRESTDAEI